MAAVTLTIHDRDTPRPDGLCPRCLNPALKTYRLVRLDMTGLTTVGHRDGCTDCKIWVGPARRIKETSK